MTALHSLGYRSGCGLQERFISYSLVSFGFLLGNLGSLKNKKNEKNTCEKIYLLVAAFGGQVCGSRDLQMASDTSDWDIFFEEKDKYEKFILFLKKNSIDSIKHEYLEEYTEKESGRYAGLIKKTRKLILHQQLDVNLVEKILPKEKQLLLHLEKYPEKIKVFFES